MFKPSYHFSFIWIFWSELGPDLFCPDQIRVFLFRIRFGSFCQDQIRFFCSGTDLDLFVPDQIRFFLSFRIRFGSISWDQNPHHCLQKFPILVTPLFSYLQHLSQTIYTEKNCVGIKILYSFPTSFFLHSGRAFAMHVTGPGFDPRDL